VERSSSSPLKVMAFLLFQMLEAMAVLMVVREPEVVKGGGGRVVEVVVEEAPDLLVAGAQQK
jgi:hypothetical protein